MSTPFFAKSCRTGAYVCPLLRRRAAVDYSRRAFLHSTCVRLGKTDGDARINDLEGGEDEDEAELSGFARLRKHYETPKNPIILAHGLLGFAELRLLRRLLPTIYYWHGITTALRALAPPPGLKVITPSVPPTGTIQQRASALSSAIAAANLPPGQPVNIIAHSMGGLDARCMISSSLSPPLSDSSQTSASTPTTTSSSTHHPTPLQNPIASLVTIATPHHGSPLANLILSHQALTSQTSHHLLTNLGLPPDALSQLSTTYLTETFNPQTPNHPSVKYYSFGARFATTPSLLSPFRRTWRLVRDVEGPNDGLVSVRSSRWGEYRGTLDGVSHLDLINWSNRLGWGARKLWTGQERPFNAVAFYLGIADMLAKEGF